VTPLEQLWLFEPGITIRREDAVAAVASSVQKYCRVCGGRYKSMCFRRHRAVCRLCQQTANDQKKARDRFPSKVQWARQSHARRLHRPASELRLMFGWTDDKMASDARQVWGDGCPSCGQNIATMPNRLSSLILRIVDRRAPPWYGVNTRWVCTFCRGDVVDLVENERGSRGVGDTARVITACGADNGPN
jgi:hypothetical protein